MENNSLIETNRTPNTEHNYIITCTCNPNSTESNDLRSILIWEVVPVREKNINGSKTI